MAIDKIIPIRLDKSSDFKLVPKTSMVDALNMLITENESSGEANETGNLGVLKNIKGNAEISYLSSAHAIGTGDSKIIGSVTDTKLKIIYFFCLAYKCFRTWGICLRSDGEASYFWGHQR